MVNVPPGLSFDVSVPLKAQRTWQRKWRDVLHDRNAIAETYQGDRIDVDDFTRRVEGFFKTCRELADWIEESTQLPAMDYARTPPTLELCDAVAQTAKHYARKPSKWDPITAVVVELFGDTAGIHADVAWRSNFRPSGRQDALALADLCIAEWKKFFQQYNLDPSAG
jgi:hypothetical protein